MKEERIVFSLCRLAAIGMVAVGVVYGSHHVFISYLLSLQGLSYEPVTVAANYDEGMYYGPRARAAYEGQFVVGDIALAEYKKSPAVLPLLNPLILGGLGRAAGSLTRGFILSDILFPALIFLGVFLLSYEATRRPMLAFVGSLLFSFVPRVFLAIPPVSHGALRELATGALPWLNTENALYFMRFEYPKLTYPLFLLALYWILRTVCQPSRASCWLAGISFGLTFYTYIYDWALLAVALGIVGITYCIRRDVRSLRRIAFVGVVGLVVAIPYFMNFFAWQELPQASDLINRLGVERGYAFRFASVWSSYARNAALIFLLWYAFRKSSQRAHAFVIGALLTAYAVVLNMQLVTGFNPQPDHWYRTQFIAIYLAILMVAALFLGRWKREAEWRAPAFLAAMCAVFIIGGQLLGQWVFSRAQAARYTIPAPYAESYEWLAAHAPKGSVIGTISAETNSEVLLYTAHRVFLPAGLNTVAPTEEIWQRLRFLAAVYRMSVEAFAAFAAANQVYLFADAYRGQAFDAYFRTDASRGIPAEALKAERAAYAEMVAAPIALPSFRLDYLYVGPRERALGFDPRRVFPGLEPVYEKNDIVVYRVLRS